MGKTWFPRAKVIFCVLSGPPYNSKMRFLLSLFVLACCFSQVLGSYFGQLIGSNATEIVTSSCTMGGSNFYAGYTYGNFYGKQNAGKADGFIYQSGFKYLYGTTGDDKILGIACDSKNFMVYAVGSTNGKLNGQSLIGSTNGFVMKIDGFYGNVISTYIFGGYGFDYATAIAVDSFSNIYIAGITQSPFLVSCPNSQPLPAGRQGGFTMKLDSNLNMIFCNTAGSSGNMTITSIAVSPNNASYAIAGYYTGAMFTMPQTNGDTDGFYINYDGKGKYMNYFNAITTSGDDALMSVKFDNQSNIVVTGFVSGPIDGNQAYGSSDIYIGIIGGLYGQSTWSAVYGTPGDDKGMGVDIGFDGTILITGYVSGMLWNQIYWGLKDIFWISLTNNGTFLQGVIQGADGDEVPTSIIISKSMFGSKYDMFISGTTNTTTFFSSKTNGGFDGFIFADNYYQAPVGNYSDRGTSVNTPCTEGQLCDVIGLHYPKYCPTGYYCPTTLAAIPCTKVGAFCPGARAVQDYCGKGYYCPNSSIAIECTQGYYCNQTSLTTQTICPAGYVCTIPQLTPVQCTQNTYCPLGSYFTQFCPIGFYCPTPAVKIACNTQCTCSTMGRTTDCIPTGGSTNTNATNSGSATSTSEVPMTQKPAFFAGIVAGGVIFLLVAGTYTYRRCKRAQRPFNELNEMQMKDMGAAKV